MCIHNKFSDMTNIKNSNMANTVHYMASEEANNLENTCISCFHFQIGKKACNISLLVSGLQKWTQPAYPRT